MKKIYRYWFIEQKDYNSFENPLSSCYCNGIKDVKNWAKTLLNCNPDYNLLQCKSESGRKIYNFSRE